jgi:hypothetical protein
LEAINFCKSLSPVEDEMQSCYRSVISGARSLYNKETINKICSLVPIKYGEMCGKLYKL